MFGLFKSKKQKLQEKLINEYDKQYFPLIHVLLTSNEDQLINAEDMAVSAIGKGMNLLARTIEGEFYDAARNMIPTLTAQFMALSGRFLSSKVDAQVNLAFDHLQEVNDALNG